MSNAKNISSYCTVDSSSCCYGEIVLAHCSKELVIVKKDGSGDRGGSRSGSPWKEADEESSVDDEEIKIKEAALDHAIREEELIEEELRQVEKDFEMVST